MEAKSGSTTREDCSSYSTFSTPPSKPPSIPIARRVGFLAGGNSSPIGRGEGGYRGKKEGRRGGEEGGERRERGREKGKERRKKGKREKNDCGSFTLLTGSIGLTHLSCSRDVKVEWLSSLLVV